MPECVPSPCPRIPFSIPPHHFTIPTQVPAPPMSAVPGLPGMRRVPCKGGWRGGLQDQRQWRRGVGEEGSPWQLCVFLLVALVSQTSGDSQSGGNTHTHSHTHAHTPRSLERGKPNKDSYTNTHRAGGRGRERKKKVGIEWSQIVCVDPETKKGVRKETKRKEWRKKSGRAVEGRARRIKMAGSL